MRLNIYKFDVKQPRDRSYLEKYLELTIKGIILFSIPLPFAAVCTLFWYYCLYGRGVGFDGQMDSIIIDAWVTTFAVLYALVTAKVLDTVWAEYKAMRSSVKMGIRGVVEFVRLRDERVSPLINVVIYSLSAVILAAFMVVHYPCVLGGVCTVASTSYLFLLMIRIIHEIDNPCGGIWFIRNVPDKWLHIDTRKFRAALAKREAAEEVRGAGRLPSKVLEQIVLECQIKQ